MWVAETAQENRTFDPVLVILSKPSLLTALVLLFFTLAGDAVAVEQQSHNYLGTSSSTSSQVDATPPGHAAVQSGATTIHLADIAIKAAEVDKLLSTVANKLPSGVQLETIRNSLPEVSIQIDRDLEATKLILSHQPSLPLLQEQQQKWQRKQFMVSGWLDMLTKRSGTTQNTLDHLENLEKTWTTTLADASASKAPELILVKINNTITAIHDSQGRLNEQLVLVLDLQSRVGKEIMRCEQALTKIADMQQSTVSGILVQDSLSVWNIELWTAESNSRTKLLSAVSLYGKDVKHYLLTPSTYILLLGANVVVLVLLFVAVRNLARKWEASGKDFSPFIKIFDYPVAAALTVSLLVITAPYRSPLPTTLRDTFEVFALLPLIVLVRPEIPDRFRPMLSALAFLFALDAIRDILFAEHLLGQIFLILESLVGLAMMVWFRRNLQTTPGDTTSSGTLHRFQFLTFPVLLLLAVGITAAVTGHLRLARIITPGIISFSVMAMAMFAALRILIGFVAFFFEVRPLNKLHMLHHHRILLERRIYRLLLWGAITGLIARSLGYIGLMDPVLAAATTVLNARIEHGTLSISIIDIVYFVLTVWASYLMSRLIRFVLSEDVYPRIRISRGKSFAVSSLLHYIILAIGFTVAISVLGVDLTKFSVLTGALGIGIGFGLQGVMKNFVSGLILLFEQPVQVGDTVEVGNLLGNVRKIGIRASTVRTRQGSDIIVPNSQLVTDKVTNWTFADRMKRIDLSVGVSYASSPKAVTELLDMVASHHPHVLKEPSPQALFVGFGDSSLNYELRAWTEYIDDWAGVRSELATAIFDAVLEAGMSFPFPQREVRLLNDFKNENAAVIGKQAEGNGPG